MPVRVILKENQHLQNLEQIDLVDFVVCDCVLSYSEITCVPHYGTIHLSRHNHVFRTIVLPLALPSRICA